MIALTLPEIRRLLIAFILTPRHAADHIWAWSRGDDADNTKPAYRTTTAAGTHSPDSECSWSIQGVGTGRSPCSVDP